MAISVRNQLEGAVEEVERGTIMARVVVRVGDNVIESAITAVARMKFSFRGAMRSLLSSKRRKS